MNGGNTPIPPTPEERASELKRKLNLASAQNMAPTANEKPMTMMERMKAKREAEARAKQHAGEKRDTGRNDPFASRIQLPQAEAPKRATTTDPKEMAARMAKYLKRSTAPEQESSVETPAEEEPAYEEHLATTLVDHPELPSQERHQTVFLTKDMDAPQKPDVPAEPIRETSEQKVTQEIPEAVQEILTQMRSRSLSSVESYAMEKMAQFLATTLEYVPANHLETELFLRRNVITLFETIAAKFPKDLSTLKNIGVGGLWNLFIIGRKIGESAVLPGAQRQNALSLFAPFLRFFEETLIREYPVLAFLHRIETLTIADIDRLYEKVSSKSQDRILAFLEMKEIPRSLEEIPEEVTLYFPLSQRMNDARMDLKLHAEALMKDLYYKSLAPTEKEILTVTQQLPPAPIENVAPPMYAGFASAPDQVESMSQTAVIKNPSIPDMPALNVVVPVTEPEVEMVSLNPVNLKQPHLMRHSLETREKPIPVNQSKARIAHNTICQITQKEGIKKEQELLGAPEVIEHKFYGKANEQGETVELHKFIHPGESIWAFVQNKEGAWIPFWSTPKVLDKALYRGMNIGAGSTRASETFGELILGGLHYTTVSISPDMAAYVPHAHHALEFTTQFMKKVRLLPAIGKGTPLEIIGRDAAQRNVHVISSFHGESFREGMEFLTDVPELNGVIKRIHYHGDRGEWTISVVHPIRDNDHKTLKLTIKCINEGENQELRTLLSSAKLTGRTVGDNFARHDRMDLVFLQHKDLGQHFKIHRLLPEIIKGEHLNMSWHFTPAVCFIDDETEVLRKRVAALSYFSSKDNITKDGLEMEAAPHHATGVGVYLFEHDGLRWYILDKESERKILVSNQLQEVLDLEVPDATHFPTKDLHQFFDHTFHGQHLAAKPIRYKETECYYQFQDEACADFQAELYNFVTVPYLLNQQEESAFEASAGKDLVLPVMQAPTRMMTRVLGHRVFSTDLWEQESKMKNFLETMEGFAHEQKLPVDVQTTTLPTLWEDFLTRLFTKKISPLFDQSITIPELGNAVVHVPHAESCISIGFKLDRYEHNHLINQKGSQHNYGERDGVTRNIVKNGYVLSLEMYNELGDSMTFHMRLEDGKEQQPEFLEVTTASRTLYKTDTAQKAPLIARNVHPEAREELPPLPAHIRPLILTNTLGLDFERVFKDYLNGIVRMGNKLHWEGMNTNKFLSIAPLADMANILERAAKGEIAVQKTLDW